MNNDLKFFIMLYKREPESLACTKCNISNTLNNRKYFKSAGGFIWKFTDNIEIGE